MNDFDPTIVLFEYTEILEKKRKTFSENFFCMKPEENEAQAIKLIRTITKAFLRCPTLTVARNTVTLELLSKIQCGRLLQYIEVPTCIDPDDKGTYIVDKIFTNNFDTEQWIVEHLCKRIMEGNLKKFPKRFMDDAIGLQRASFCLNYLLKRYKPTATSLELYQYAASSAFKDYLKDKLLLNVALRQYDTPVEFLHYSLDEDLQNNGFFAVYNSVYRMDSGSKIEIIADETESAEKVGEECVDELSTKEDSASDNTESVEPDANNAKKQTK